MSTPRTTIPDALLKRALVERASGPDTDLLPGILASVAASRQRRGWVVELEQSRRPLAVGLIAAVLTIALVGTVLIGAGIWRPRSVDGILHGNGPIVVAMETLVVVDPVTAEIVDRLPQPAMSFFGRMAWSPRGDRLAVAGEGSISIFDPVDRGLRQIATCDWCTVSWAPDGSQLAVGRSGEIGLVDPSDGRVVGTVSVPGIDVLASSWEPAGDRIAFAGRAADGVRLYVVDRDGSGLRSLDGPIEDLGIGDVGWSPADDTIAYLRIQPRTPTSTSSSPTYDLQVMVAAVDGATAPTRIVDAGMCFCVGFSPGLGWSPDGQWLAITSLDADMSGGLYLARADGSDFHRILDGPAGTPAWRPVP